MALYGKDVVVPPHAILFDRTAPEAGVHHFDALGGEEHTVASYRRGCKKKERALFKKG